MDAEALLLKIHSGGVLQDEELEEIVTLLSAFPANGKSAPKLCFDDIYVMLLVLGRARVIRQKTLLEKYLIAKDPLTISLVLEILCLEWNLVEDYLEQVINFALGVSWDKDEDVRHSAIKILGEYLFGTVNSAAEKDASGQRSTEKNLRFTPRQLRVLELLFNVFDEKNVEVPLTRQVAYYSLCRAHGKTWDEIPSDCRQLDLCETSSDIDRSVVDYLRSLLLSDSSSSTPSDSGGASSGMR